MARKEADLCSDVGNIFSGHWFFHDRFLTGALPSWVIGQIMGLVPSDKFQYTAMQCVTFSARPFSARRSCRKYPVGNIMNDESTDEPKMSPVPLSASARRVLGVLVEKAKTTPDNYPLTLAGIVTGSNQKSNRDPKMDLDEDDVLLALDELRKVGAAREVQGSGRAIKYRHAAYDWLDVDGSGSAVMTELLLRGPQTLGELPPGFSYASICGFERHEAADIRPYIGGITHSTGRGQVFSHTLYPAQERQYLNAKVEKQNASRTTSTATETSNSNRTAVDWLLDRLVVMILIHWKNVWPNPRIRSSS